MKVGDVNRMYCLLFEPVCFEFDVRADEAVNQSTGQNERIELKNLNEAAALQKWPRGPQVVVRF